VYSSIELKGPEDRRLGKGVFAAGDNNATVCPCEAGGQWVF
jgi:hypothetical protein